MPEQPQPPAPRTPTDPTRPAVEQPAAEDPGSDLSHRWGLATTLEVAESAARLGVARRYHLITLVAKEGEPSKARVKFRVEDAYCLDCHLAFHAAVDQPCAAKRGENEHLIGGDQRERAKRKPKVIPAGAELVAGPTIDRRGVRAVVLGP